jgi:hypothetical protein
MHLEEWVSLRLKFGPHDPPSLISYTFGYSLGHLHLVKVLIAILFFNPLISGMVFILDIIFLIMPHDWHTEVRLMAEYEANFAGDGCRLTMFTFNLYFAF